MNPFVGYRPTEDSEVVRCIPNYYDLCEKIWDDFNAKYGTINGVGFTKLNNYYRVDENGTPAIAIYFESMKPGVTIDQVPKEFEGVPVHPMWIGVIRAG